MPSSIPTTVALLFFLSLVLATAADATDTCAASHARCAGAPRRPHVDHAECCDSMKLCAVDATRGWGSFCIDRPVCADTAEMNPAAAAIAKTLLHDASGVAAGLLQYVEQGLTVGSTTALIPEASDASVTNATVADGQSGDIDFPHGRLKPLATVGERSVCPTSMGSKITGVPDGLGAYLVDEHTVRVVVQSESYGPLRGQETYKYPVNDGMANFTGSHVHYVDYDREMMSKFMRTDKPASDMVVGMGEMIETAYNLKGELIGPRNGKEKTPVGAHYGNTDSDGKYVAIEELTEADWFYQSFCSAHMEQRHQWGPGIGLEDDLFMTNEEWHNYSDGEMFVGIGSHAIDVHKKTAHAVGVFNLGGFEKVVEINAQHPDYVMFAISGYNGAFDGYSAVLEARKREFKRDDGKVYVWTRDIHPFRIYVGVKGLCENGAKCGDFLARNGLKYGQVYGFAIDMSLSGPTGGMWRDDFHRDPTKAMNGAKVRGKWIAQPWRWDGTVRNFQYDGSWDYQNNPPVEGYSWWNSDGYDKGGKKTEHISPDPRPGRTAYVQTSTAGYFGHLYVHGVANKLSTAMGGLPDQFEGTYYVYQGELDITEQIELGGKGQYADGRDATRNWDGKDPDGKKTFEDVDGFEVFHDGNKLYAMIQEDSGNEYGERMFLTGPLEHAMDGRELTYYFVAMSGGERNTRMSAGVGVPAGTSCKASAHEFSGVFDMSGLLRKNKNGCGFRLSAFDTGYEKRKHDRLVSINEKYIIVGLQAHNLACGVIKWFAADRGGQWLLYQPDIPLA